MPLINHTKREINAKLVYVGPAAAGKATNLSYVYTKLKQAFRGKFKSMNLQSDRMLFFDFVPAGQGDLEGYSIRFHIYTLSGEVTHPSSWKMVLKGADGLVMVADSTPGRMAANLESLKQVTACLAVYDRTLGQVPCVLQCNKRDAVEAVDPEAIRKELSLLGAPLFPAVASKGEGVLETLFTLVKMVVKEIRAGGINVGGQPEQLQRIAEPAEQGRPEAEQPMRAAYEAGAGEEARFSPSEEVTAAPADTPVVEVAGAQEPLAGGGVRLPLSIRCGGKVTKMSLNITLTPEPD